MSYGREGFIPFREDEEIDEDTWAAAHRRGRRRTKEDMMLGVFADDDSGGDEEEDKRRRKTFAKPVPFVSGGASGALGEEEDRTGEEKTPAGAGLGWGHHPHHVTPTGSDSDGSQTRGVEKGMGFHKGHGMQGTLLSTISAMDHGLPMHLGPQRGRGRRPKVLSGPSKTSAGSNAANGPGWVERSSGGEKAFRMMKMMGYVEGRGLGKQKKGTTTHVEVEVRPGQVGLGHHSFQSALPHKNKEIERALTGRDGVEEPEDEVSRPAVTRREKGWKVGVRRRKTVYKTVEDVLAHGQGIDTKQKVVDMRGPEVRVLSNLSDISQSVERVHLGPKILPELQFNIGFLVDLAEVDIQNTDRKIRQERDNMSRGMRERERLEQRLVKERLQSERLQEVLDIITRAQERIKETTDSHAMDILEKVFDILQSKYQEEYVTYGLNQLSVPLVRPLLQKHIASWNPLQDPRHGADVFLRWKGLLGKDEGSSSVYQQLINELVLPRLRNAILNEWKPRDCEPCVQLLECWNGILPRALFDHILNQMILPRIHAAVDEWVPRRDPIPIHLWIHPWLPHLPLESIYSQIRHKLSASLETWHPSDPSAMAVLAPWHDVFDAQAWEQVMLRQIVPKLALVLREFVVNPVQQVLDPIQWVFAWEGFVAPSHLARVFQKEFFPKWFQALYRWLTSNPNFDEVTRWYMGWKNLFPASLRQHETIRAQFTQALDMMNQAVAGKTGVSPLLPPPQIVEPASLRTSTPSSPKPTRKFDMDMSLRDMVERFAEENDLVFAPQRRQWDGKQVYSFGGVPCVVGKESLHLQESGVWHPTTLSDLVEFAKKERRRQ